MLLGYEVRSPDEWADLYSLLFMVIQLCLQEERLYLLHLGINQNTSVTGSTRAS